MPNIPELGYGKLVSASGRNFDTNFVMGMISFLVSKMLMVSNLNLRNSTRNAKTAVLIST
jgi:hypothetical protein